jgi:hypothetical protein
MKFLLYVFAFWAGVAIAAALLLGFSLRGITRRFVGTAEVLRG